MDKMEDWSQQVAHDRDIIVYCSCPNEVTSARFALLLKRKGFTRIWPLLGELLPGANKNIQQSNTLPLGNFINPPESERSDNMHVAWTTTRSNNHGDNLAR